MTRKANIEKSNEFIYIQKYCSKYKLFNEMLKNLKEYNYDINSILNKEDINYFICSFESIKETLDKTEFNILNCKFIESPNSTMVELRKMSNYENAKDFTEKFKDLVSNVYNMLKALNINIDLEIIKNESKNKKQ